MSHLDLRSTSDVERLQPLLLVIAGATQGESRVTPKERHRLTKVTGFFNGSIHTGATVLSGSPIWRSHRL
jgi:hypothetical protein